MKNKVGYHLFFAIEMAIGLTTLIAVLILGDIGFSFLSFMAALPLLKRSKPDERETHLLLKANTFTLVALYLTMFIIYFIFPSLNWLMVMGGSFIFYHGLGGLLMFGREYRLRKDY